MSEIHHLLDQLAPLFASEARPGGDLAAAAIAQVHARPDWRDTDPADPMPGLIKAALAIDPHPIASALRAAHPHLSWHASGLADGRIRAEIANRMITTEIIGPDGMLFHPTVRVGLFAQSADTDYVTREHAAEETFVMLAGRGDWSSFGASPRERQAGDVIHHPSMAPHVSVTRDTPFVAAWRWTGEIGYDGYALTS